MRVVAVINQKGGVGKTTTVANLGAALAAAGERVMLLDMDPQGHLAECLGLHDAPATGADQVMDGGVALDSVAVEVRPGLRLVRSGQSLAEIGGGKAELSRARLLADAIEAAPPAVDTLLIDCPPSATLLAANAAIAADDALVPVAGDYLSLTGLARLLLTLQGLQRVRHRPLTPWLFLSRFVGRRRLAKEVHAKLRQHFPDRLLATKVSEAAVMAECAARGRTVFELQPRSRSAQQYRQLADDLRYSRLEKDVEESTSDVA